VTAADEVPGFTLYYREYCHLCDSMRQALIKLQQQAVFDWVEVDIDRDPQLVYRFDTLVPVLYFNDHEVCHHFIDEPAILAVIAAYEKGL